MMASTVSSGVKRDVSSRPRPQLELTQRLVSWLLVRPQRAAHDETLQGIGFDVDTPVEALCQEPRNGRLAGARDARDEEDTRIHIVGFHGKPPFPIIRRPREDARLFHAMKTFVATPADRERNWLVVDAAGKTLGRLATQIADLLRGKGKPEYTPHVDTGDFVVVINAEKIAVTGNKLADKRYYRHSGYPGGLRSRTLGDMLERRPEEVIRRAVRGMMPRNRLARKQLTKLKVYAGPDHPHAAQKPQPLEINT
jgi:large subunit ribosomal protein L13